MQVCYFVTPSTCQVLVLDGSKDISSSPYTIEKSKDIPQEVAIYRSRTNQNIPSKMVRSLQYFPDDGLIWPGHIHKECLPPKTMKHRWLTPEEKQCRWFVIQFPNQSKSGFSSFPSAKYPECDIALDLIETFDHDQKRSTSNAKKRKKRSRDSNSFQGLTMGQIKKRIIQDHYPEVEHLNKKKIRCMIFEEAKRINPCGNIFDLESAECRDVAFVQSQWETCGYPKGFYIANDKYHTYQKILSSNLLPDWVHVEYGTDLEFFQKPINQKRTYSLINLDRQGNVSANDRERLKELLGLIVNKRLLGPKGVLAVTFSERSSIPHQDFSGLHKPYTLMMEFLGQVIAQQEEHILPNGRIIKYANPIWHPYNYKKCMYTIFGILELQEIGKPTKQDLNHIFSNV